MERTITGKSRRVADQDSGRSICPHDGGKGIPKAGRQYPDPAAGLPIHFQVIQDNGRVIVQQRPGDIWEKTTDTISILLILRKKIVEHQVKLFLLCNPSRQEECLRRKSDTELRGGSCVKYTA